MTDLREHLVHGPPGTKTCAVCGDDFTPAKATSRTCSAHCRNVDTSRRTATKRGDKLRGRGEGKSYTKRDGRHEHRIVAEQTLGRPLRPGEIVHHRDDDHTNNDPDNLVVVETQAEHARLHNPAYPGCDVDGCDRKHVARGLCRIHYNRAKRNGTLPPTLAQRGGEPNRV